jgi:SAM-dependent methyltransferase
MKEMWDQRFAGEEYAYGIQPNVFFKEKITGLKPGRLLLPAEGEGRNAVFAAGLGWQVTAVDFSEQARVKAINLAQKSGVNIEYTIGDLVTFDFSKEVYDAVALIYAHLHQDFRKEVHQKIINSLKPGGYIIFEAFNKNQINKNSGGPKSLEMLYSTSMLQDDFKGLEFIVLEEANIILEQGVYHQGESDIIRLFARKSH